MTDVNKALRDGEVLIIVPPFAKLVYQSLGAHVLQALARERGVKCQVLYLSMFMAAEIGVERYRSFYDESFCVLLGERFFARQAFGRAPLGENVSEMTSMARDFGEEKAARIDLDVHERARIDLDAVREQEAKLDDWLERVTDAIAAKGYPIVGCTSMFQQISSSVAILNRIKAKSPQTITIIGGANCEGEMAEGMASLGADIDHIFSGESEKTFVRFLDQALAGEPPAEKILAGEPCLDMNALPAPTFEDYYGQLDLLLGDQVPLKDTWVMYETSRGCWWGQKQHCTFCGLNGEGMAFRQKSPDRVIGELEVLAKTAPTRNVMMADNIMPHNYFKALLPELTERGLNLNMFYEMKANLSLERVMALKRAGINSIQPGIEALSTYLLKRMRKGVSARQNLMLLRYGMAAGVNLTWNLLWGFADEEPEAFEETLAIAPLIHHLQPPNAVGHLSVERFSPYFYEPERHNIRNIRPLASYRDIFPENADVEKLAYHFVADYESGGYERIDLVRALRDDVDLWKAQWNGKAQRHVPELCIRVYEGELALIDTRGLEGTEQVRLLERDEAALLLTSRRYNATPAEDRAIERKLATVMDGWFTPLAVADPELILEFEAEAKRPAATERSFHFIPPAAPAATAAAARR